MYWSLGGSTAEESGQAGRVLDDRPCGGQDSPGRAGCSSHPGGPVEIEPVLDATGKMSLTFAQDLQDEVVPPPQVTPQNASGYSAEVTRIGTDVLFKRKSPAEAAEELLAVIEESSG